MALTRNRHRMIAGAAVNVLDYGAKLDGVTNDTAAWNAALASGKNVYFPEGTSVITNKITLSPSVQSTALRGAGRNKSIFKISYTTFNMAADAVFQMGSHFQGLHGVSFYFDQPSTSVRANIKQYPPCIDINGMSRSELSNIRIESAYVGIRAQGNCGGGVWDDILMGALFQGIIIDGALDSIRINRFHFWPFGYSGDSGLMAVLNDGGTFCMDVGRCDDLVINSMISFQGRIIFTDHGGGFPFGSITNLTLDTGYARIEFYAGKFTISCLGFSTRNSNDFLIVQNAGELKVVGFYGEAGSNLTPNALVNISGAAARFIGTNFFFTAIGVPSAPVFRVSAGQAVISDGMIQAATGANQTTPVIEVTGGRATICHVRFSDKGGGTGTAIRIANDDYHVCMGNSAPGWAYSFPGTQTSGIYGPNK
jgi:hypothetical protein